VYEIIISAVKRVVELVTNVTNDFLSVRMPQQDKSVGLKNGSFNLCTFSQGGQENKLFNYGGISVL
jgi:hypothetical protein